MSIKTLRLGAAIAAVAGLLSASNAAQATDYPSAYVEALQSEGGANNCFFFILEGVGPTNPTGFGPWFAIEYGQDDAKATFAMLLAAKMTREKVYVRSTTTGCGGYAIADAVWIAP